MLHWGRAFSATAELSTMPFCTTSSAASATFSFTHSTDLAYSVRNSSINSGFFST
jgi:hypothetical protein